MAKSNKTPRKLSFIDIVICADAEVIKEAYEARVRIDGLLDEREAAYARIRELEDEIETIVGEEGVFSYPPPVLPVAGNERPAEAKRQRSTGTNPRPAPKPRPQAGKNAEAEAVPTEQPSQEPTANKGTGVSDEPTDVDTQPKED